ncbi:hypothetical protein WA026_004521 [Henosepilachna vigintioctopunctata]|uniref:PCNA-associated factor histone-like domain-containing protein n=1 Tax=Henosepilachna vigintioctopunctata TaxID=420089 RepID=A0AAW1VBJ1_9CUCU
MVRTGERCVRVAGGKSSEKKRGTGTPSTAAGPSTSSSNSGIGGNPVCPRETPSWQKPITCFFPKIEGHGQQFIEKEMAESSKTNIPNRETVPVVAGTSTEEDQPMFMEEASSVQDTEKNKFPDIAKNSPDPVSPSKDMNLNETDKTHDKKNESLLATPKSEKKLESSNDHLALSKSGLRNIAASRKRFGHDSGGTMDDTEVPAKKLKLDDALRETQSEEAAGCSISKSYYDFLSATPCPTGNESDSSGFDEYTSRKREHPDSASDANNETPKKKLRLENTQPQYQMKKPPSLYDDIIVVSSDEENSDMELDDSINFSPENPYMYMNGNNEEVANNAVHGPPPQDEVPQGQNNPMELGYAGNDDNDNIPDNVYYPVENGYPEDDGSLAGNNSDDDPPEDSDEEETDTDIEDDDEDEDDEENEGEDEDDQDDGGVPFYANIHFYHNHIEE